MANCKCELRLPASLPGLPFATVASEMAPSAALVALIVPTTTAASVASSESSTTTASTTSATTTAGPSILSGGQFHTGSAPANRPSVQSAHRIRRIAGTLKLHEGEARRIAGYPDAAQTAVRSKYILQVVLPGIVAQIAHVHLSIARMARHFCLFRFSPGPN